MQQWLGFAGRPECAAQLRQLKQAMAADPEPFWAAVAASEPPAALLELLVQKCRAEEDKLRAEGKEARRAGWRQWCLAESEGGMRALFRWIRDGPSSLQSTGIVVRADGLFAGQKALLAASEEAWWPLWQNPAPPKWERVNPPRATAGWQPQAFNGEELWGLIWSLGASKAPGHDGWQVRRMRQWPVSVWHCLAILFKAVEEAGRWPTSLRGGVVCLLPKAGVQATTSTPLEASGVAVPAVPGLGLEEGPGSGRMADSQRHGRPARGEPVGRGLWHPPGRRAGAGHGVG